MSASITRASRRYAFGFGLAMTGYGVVLIGAFWLAEQPDFQRWLPALALAPLAPLVWAAHEFLRFRSRTDEMQRRIVTEAAALTALIAIFLAMALGFLEIFGVLELRYALIWFGPGMIFVWGAVNAVMFIRRASA